MRRPRIPARSTFLLALLAAAAGAPPAGAEVVDSAAHGFTVRNRVEIDAEPGTVYSRLQEIGAWWSSDHTFSGDAANLSLDPHPGGCFCERLPGGGGVLHLTVVRAEPGKLLRLAGGLGPFQGTGVTGSLTFALSPVAGETARTEVVMTYQAGGYLPGGPGELAAAVDGVLGEQLTRFERYLETGAPEPAGD